MERGYAGSASLSGSPWLFFEINEHSAIEPFHFDACHAAPRDGVRCCHLSGETTSIPDAGVQQKGLAALMLRLSEKIQVCPAVVSWMAFAIAAAGHGIDQSRESWGKPALLHSAASRLQGRHKRQRADPHFRELVTAANVVSGQSHSANETMRVSFGASEASLGKQWQVKRLQEQVAAQWLSCQGPALVVGASFDGTPLGRPKRDLLLSVLWLAKERVALVGAPQVTGFSVSLACTQSKESPQHLSRQIIFSLVLQVLDTPTSDECHSE